MATKTLKDEDVENTNKLAIINRGKNKQGSFVHSSVNNLFRKSEEVGPIIKVSAVKKILNITEYLGEEEYKDINSDYEYNMNLEDEKKNKKKSKSQNLVDFKGKLSAKFSLQKKRIENIKLLTSCMENSSDLHYSVLYDEATRIEAVTITKYMNSPGSKSDLTTRYRFIPFSIFKNIFG